MTLACTVALAYASAASASTVTGKPGRDFVPGELLVRAKSDANFIELRLPDGITVREAARALDSNPEVAYAVANRLARIADDFNPNDPGKTGAGDADWTDRQWNFLANSAHGGPEAGGIDAPGAWTNLGAGSLLPGAGVKVAVIDTGVAYRDLPAGCTSHCTYKRSPDFADQFTKNKYDWVGDDAVPLDKNGHGTHVAGTIAEQTNNVRQVTGLAYGAKIMPLRVIPSSGDGGESSDIARAIRFAADRYVNVINLSLEFSPGTTKADVMPVIEAINNAHSRGSVMVAAAGNNSTETYFGTDSDQLHTPPRVALPARADYVIGVGGVTAGGCLARYSEIGDGLDLVAPGGGQNASSSRDPDCVGQPNPGQGVACSMQPDAAPDACIWQVTLTSIASGNYRSFGIRPKSGTSMSAAHVSGVAALVIASGILGTTVTPDGVEDRLESEAIDLGASGFDSIYGAGLLDADAATAP